MHNINELLTELACQRFYGSLEIKFEAGKVVLLRKTETIKPPPEDYRISRGKDHEPKHHR